MRLFAPSALPLRLAGTADTARLRSRAFSCSFWLLCAALLLAWHTTNQLDSDEGVILSGAWHLLNGQTLYTDFFEFIAPGSFYLIFGLWKLFGANFVAAKLAAILAILAAAAGVYRISLLLALHEGVDVPRWTLFIGPFVYCLMSGYWPAINHNTFNIAFLVWAAYFLARSVLRRSFWDASVGGLISGVAVAFLQHRGLAFVGSTLLVLGGFYARDRDLVWAKNSGAFLLGVMVPIGAVLLLWPGSLLIENLIRFPARNYLEVNRVDPSLFLLIASSLLVAVWLLRACPSRPVWLLLFLQGTLFLTALQRPDYSHISIVLFPILSLFPLLLTATKTSELTIIFQSWSVAGPLVLLFPLFIFISAHPTWREDKSKQSQVLRYIKENCNSSPYIYAGPFSSGYYFETRKLNPTRYSALLTNLNTNDQFLEAKTGIETHRPQCIVTDYEMVEKFNYDKSNPVDRYIAANYKVARRDGPVQVLVAK